MTLRSSPRHSYTICEMTAFALTRSSSAATAKKLATAFCRGSIARVPFLVRVCGHFGLQRSQTIEPSSFNVPLPPLVNETAVAFTTGRTLIRPARRISMAGEESNSRVSFTPNLMIYMH